MTSDDEAKTGARGDDATRTGPPPSEIATGPGAAPVAPHDEETRLPTGPPSPARRHDGPFGQGQQIGTRYTIIKLLGAGGMGAVYQAWDAELNVAVAIKTILPDRTRDAAASRDLERRFKSEL